MSELSDKLRRKLRKLTNGLMYPSESDAPIVTLHWFGSADMPFVLNRLGRRRDVPVVQQTVDQLFDPWLSSLAEHPIQLEAVRRLHDVLVDSLQNLTVYRVGSVDVTIVVIGQADDGDWLGVKTTSVET